MATFALSHVWLVLDADRDVVEVLADEDGAKEAARRQDCTAERWPISSGARAAAWNHALQSVGRITREPPDA